MYSRSQEAIFGRAAMEMEVGGREWNSDRRAIEAVNLIGIFAGNSWPSLDDQLAVNVLVRASSRKVR